MSIIKHSYLSSRQPAAGKTGAVAGLGRALAHVKYIQHRPGPDKEGTGREMFDDVSDSVDGKKFRAAIRAVKGAKVVAHKIILSPEIPVEDKKAYTRELMAQMSKDKGLDFNYIATGHDNTDHAHVHVMLLGVDKNGKDIFIGKQDHAKLREASERYLERIHPIELGRYREEQERKKDKARAPEKDRGLKSPERALEGVQLPWMHRKIVREQLEPYKDWKGKKDAEKNRKAEAPEKSEAPEREEAIEAAGKTWSKTNSHKELTDLNQYLWDNQQERIPKKDYKKLVAWIKEKEVGPAPERDNTPIEANGKQWTKDSSLEELRSLNAQLWENLDQRIHVDDYKKLVSWMKEKEREGDSRPKEKAPEKADSELKKEKDSFEYNGQTYNEKTPPEKLTGLAKKLREDKSARLPVEDYQHLRGWIENADRAPWSGYLAQHVQEADKSLKKEQAENIKHGPRWQNPVQQEMMGNPVVGVFLQVASVVNELVKMAPAKDVQDDLSTAHKVLKREKSDRHKINTQIGRPKEKKEFDERIFERLEGELDYTEDKIDKAARKKQRKTKENDIAASKDDPFVFDPWGMQ